MFCHFIFFVRSHKTLYMFNFYFFIIHNGRLAVISLFTDRYKAHTSVISFFQRK